LKISIFRREVLKNEKSNQKKIHLTMQNKLDKLFENEPSRKSGFFSLEEEAGRHGCTVVWLKANMFHVEGDHEKTWTLAIVIFFLNTWAMFRHPIIFERMCDVMSGDWNKEWMKRG
jgi:hypothetical protein